MPIPVTIITGFLGAGKTTLLNRLIQDHPDTRFALIVNEFGDIGIDGSLLVEVGEDLFELSNGCLCCTLNNELVETLFTLLRSGRTFDHLIIETTGMAEPDGIAAAFVSDPAIQQRLQLNATVCVVDGINLEASLSEREEARRQITFADFLLVNKAGDLSEEKRVLLEKILRQMNPFARIAYADYGRTDTDLLRLQAFQLPTVQLNIRQAVAQTPAGRPHTTGVIAHSFTFDQPFDFLKFMHWSKVLLMVQGQHIYRIKGILYFQNEDQRFIFQSVRNQSAMQRGDAWREGERRRSRVVVIGKGLKYEAFERALRSLIA
jgi:G3E family GTPase